ncbi:hypothetical protein AB0E69_36425 [Kribbella sp. NPDC026611]|uniref:hypothetical protein n=1 Tax=Kribbella sp. NPDC026611 TaxID=3154911 RepID=UPI0033E3735C
MHRLRRLLRAAVLWSRLLGCWRPTWLLTSLRTGLLRQTTRRLLLSTLGLWAIRLLLSALLLGRVLLWGPHLRAGLRG